MTDRPQGAALTAANADIAVGEPATEPAPFDPAIIDALRKLDYGKLLLLAPRDDTTGGLLALLNAARRSILISIYGFTIPQAADILIAKHQAGVDVRILFDHTQACGPKEKALVARLAAAGVPHWVGTSPKARQILHSKVCVVDGELAESGSWNYSLSGSKQANTWVLEKSPDAAAKLTAFIEDLIGWVAQHEPQWNEEQGVPG